MGILREPNSSTMMSCSKGHPPIGTLSQGNACIIWTEESDPFFSASKLSHLSECFQNSLTTCFQTKYQGTEHMIRDYFWSSPHRFVGAVADLGFPG